MARPNAPFSLADGARRGGLLRALLDGAVLLAVWASLWTFLALGVGGPLGRLDDQLSRRAAAGDRG